MYPQHVINKLVSAKCVGCGKLTTKEELDNEELHFFRVRGDSRYGYEVFHTACLDD
ncbi:hypothetical protein KC887_02390 [Candidatus Kaiserbacteria bacterium]|nr:hypothetical protein [Candidatus Kaiserbacteria bacterium]